MVTKKNSDKELKKSLKEIVGEELVEDAMDIVEKTLDWYGGFLSSKEFDSLNKKQRDLSEEIVVDFLGLTFYNQKVTPEKWNTKTLKTYCHETLPEEKFKQSDEYFKNIPTVLTAFFNFLAKDNLLAAAKTLAAEVTKMEDEFTGLFARINSDEDEDSEDGDDGDNKYLDSEELLDEVYEWFLAFEKSEFYQNLSEAEQTNAEEVVLNFTDFMFGFHHSVPEEWNWESIEDCCMNTLPENLPATEEVFQALVPTLSGFLNFLEEVKILEKGASLAKKLIKLEPKILKKAAEPANWSMEKITVMRARAAGVDIHDEKAMDKFIAKATKELEKEFDLDEEDTEPGETVKRTEPKIGRNDPCPCGSGKKYKKCHGKNLE